MRNGGKISENLRSGSCLNRAFRKYWGVSWYASSFSKSLPSLSELPSVSSLKITTSSTRKIARDRAIRPERPVFSLRWGTSLVNVAGSATERHWGLLGTSNIESQRYEGSVNLSLDRLACSHRLLGLPSSSGSVSSLQPGSPSASSPLKGSILAWNGRTSTAPRTGTRPIIYC